MSGAMTDGELAAFLHLSKDEAAIVIPSLSPERRALFDTMQQLTVDVALWELGLAPKPDYALIDTERSTRRRRAWR